VPSLRLETATDSLDLDSQLKTGTGVQVHAGVTGLGLAPVSVQWLEGAGDGAVYRGKRRLPRDIDMPISVLGRDRAHMKELLSKLAMMLDQECTLRLVEDDGSSWFTKLHHIGGGDYVYGTDTVGTRDVSMMLTFRAGDPFWTAENPLQATTSKPTSRPFLPRLIALRVTSSQQIGKLTLENPGDAPAHPVWVVTGPGDNFKAVSPSGETLHWMGTLLAGDTLTIDTKKGTVTDQTGANRYAELAPVPRFWAIPHGTTTAEASLQNTTTDSRVRVTWRPRRRLVI
jgi:hypothetical protein